MREFELFLDGTRAAQKEIRGAIVSYREWEPENDRQSKAIWRNLGIWRARRKRKSFPDIAQEFHISEENAKKNFYNIHSLITGRVYNPESYRRDYWIIRIPELKKTCNTCPKRNSGCTILCPDALGFVDQDQEKKEQILELNETLRTKKKKNGVWVGGIDDDELYPDAEKEMLEKEQEEEY